MFISLRVFLFIHEFIIIIFLITKFSTQVLLFRRLRNNWSQLNSVESTRKISADKNRAQNLFVQLTHTENIVAVAFYYCSLIPRLFRIRTQECFIQSPMCLYYFFIFAISPSLFFVCSQWFEIRREYHTEVKSQMYLMVLRDAMNLHGWGLWYVWREKSSNFSSTIKVDRRSLIENIFINEYPENQLLAPRGKNHVWRIQGRSKRRISLMSRTSAISIERCLFFNPTIGQQIEQ
jgi:hypothetical protein